MSYRGIPLIKRKAAGYGHSSEAGRQATETIGSQREVTQQSKPR